MKYCVNCGKEIEQEIITCPDCGMIQNTNEVIKTEEEGSKIGFGILGFFIPVAGLILYILWKKEKPQTAKAAGKGALISVIMGVVFYVVMMVVMMFFVGSEVSDMEEYLGEEYYAEEIYDFDI